MKDIGVLGTIFDEQKHILLVHQTYRGSKWMSPGGGVEPGEAPWTAVVREVKEETGLDVEVERLVSVYYFADREALGIQFLCRKISGVLQADGKEISEAKFIDPSDPPSPITRNGRQRMADALVGQEQPFLRVFDTVHIIDRENPDALTVDDASGHSHRNAKPVFARGIVQDEQGRVLYIRQDERDIWTLPECKVTAGQAPWQAIVREVGQVTGLDVQIERLMGLVFAADENSLVFEFSCSLAGHPAPPDNRAKWRFAPPSQDIAHLLASGRGITYFQTKAKELL